MENSSLESAVIKLKVKKSYGESQIIIKKSAIWDFVFKKVGDSGVMCEYC